MNRLFLFRFSIIKLKGIFNKKFNFILNFAIFLTFFAITASAISIYYENKIEKLEIKITKDEIKHVVFTKWLNRTPKLISDINNIFPLIDLKAKYYLSKTLSIPLFFIIYQKETFFIYEIKINNEVDSKLKYKFNEKDFIIWWVTLKGLSQPKPLMEASSRVQQSIFD